MSAPKLNLGTLRLKPGVQIETVVKEVKAMRTSQKGDTVSYNAGALQGYERCRCRGASEEDARHHHHRRYGGSPGRRDQEGFCRRQGVFGEDVTTAIKSLPAEAVDRVEVYNKLSDAAEFSGMDDGEGYKALNIVTKPGMRQGQFGKIYAGYGYDADTQTEDRNKYIAGGNVNIFSGDSRVSLIALFNNVNQQNFSFEDILSVTGSSGGGRRGGVGQYMTRPQRWCGQGQRHRSELHTDTWGKRDQVSFQGSYFFNNTNTTNRSTIEKWYEAPMAIDTPFDDGVLRYEGFQPPFKRPFGVEDL